MSEIDEVVRVLGQLGELRALIAEWKAKAEAAQNEVLFLRQRVVALENTVALELAARKDA